MFVERCIKLWGSAGQADAVLAQSQRWLPVEHLIIFNVEGIDEKETQAMMAQGKRILSAIPGVREVITGEAVKQDADYRYAWVMHFCHAAVIDSFRAHPDYIAFADQQFRPVACGRISIDYQSLG